MALLDEYLASCLLTFLFAICFYFLLASVSYLLLFRWGQQKFTPQSQQLR